ncbi:MAG: carboxylesterase/lipase family protein [Candidatus Thorarchaeota archaeon]
MEKEIIIETKTGKVKGYEREGIQKFKGIPYAEPPVENLRFSSPILKKPWSGVLDCTKFGPVVPQRESFFTPQPPPLQDEEKCLTLNIWTPGLDDTKRPVLFWIHGGGFSFGSGSLTNGTNLAKFGNTAIVSINYRLGIFGYIFIQDELANLGQLDQITALQWVRDNITFFGGDPNRVTIFGESAGGVAVSSLMAMPAAKGLFKRVISQSGAVHPGGFHPKGGIRGAERIMAELGLKAFDVEGLKNVPTQKIVDVQTKMELEARAKGRTFPYGVFVDGKTLPKHPLEAIRDGFASDLELIVGTNQDEAKLYTALTPPSNILDEEGLFKRTHNMIRFFNQDESVAQKVIETYKEARKDTLPIEPQEILDAISTDFRFRVSGIRLAEAQCKHQRNVFSYLFTYKSPEMGGKLGACHGLEIAFVFGTLGDKARGIVPKRSNETDILSEKMMNSWISFARNGNPNHDGIPKWNQYELKNRSTIIFGTEVKVVDDPFKMERTVWEGIF